MSKRLRKYLLMKYIKMLGTKTSKGKEDTFFYKSVKTRMESLPEELKKEKRLDLDLPLTDN